jgi:hypothetical protein
MTPFEALYVRKCWTPLMWSEVGERSFFGPATIVEVEENMAKVKEHLKVAQSRQKSYVRLRVFPLRVMKRIHVDRKLSPRYIGSYMITRRIGKLAYQLELPQELIRVHLVFHVSQLQKCVKSENKVSTENLKLQDTLEYLEFPFRI